MLTKLTHVLLFLAFFTPVQASYIPPEPVKWPVSLEQREETVKDLIDRIGTSYGANSAQKTLIYKIIKCENKELEPTQQSRHKRPDGSREQSYGLAQVYIPAQNKGTDGVVFTQATASDPVYSLGFIVKEVVNGNKHLWTCSRLVQ